MAGCAAETGRNRESGCHEVEMRLHSEVDLDRLRDINKHESQQTEAKLEPEAHQVLNMSSTMFMDLFVGTWNLYKVLQSIERSQSPSKATNMFLCKT